MPSDWVAIGRLSRQKGRRKQNYVRRFFEQLFNIEPPKFAAGMGHEERWSHLPLWIEVKAGDQIRRHVEFYVACRDQYSARPDDGKPFAAVLMPDGWGTEGIVMMTLTHLEELCEMKGGLIRLHAGELTPKSSSPSSKRKPSL
jgi:hypothetical protein